MTQTIVQSVWKPILFSAKIGYINRLLGILFRLITIPLVINHLGFKEYGLWITLASFSSFVMMFDFGISMALVNRLTRLYSFNNRKGAEEYISTALVALTAVAISISLLFCIVIHQIDWLYLLRLSTQMNKSEVTRSIIIAIIIYCYQLPFLVILKLPYTMQNGWLSEAYQIVGTIITSAGIFCGVHWGAGLSFFVFFLAGSQLIASSALMLHLVILRKLSLPIPSLIAFKERLRELTNSGFNFMLLQSISMLMTSLPVTLLAFFHGTGEVALYGLMLQVVAALALPFSVLQQPMWTRMNQLLNHTHYSSVNLMFMKYIKYAFVYSILTSSIIMFLLNPILNTFLNKNIDVPLALRIAFSLYCALGLVAGGGVGTVLLALDLARPMAVIGTLQLVLFLICALLFAPIYGTLAIVLSVSATYCISIPCSVWLIRKHSSLIN